MTDGWMTPASAASEAVCRILTDSRLIFSAVAAVRKVRAADGECEAEARARLQRREVPPSEFCVHQPKAAVLLHSNLKRRQVLTTNPWSSWLRRAFLKVRSSSELKNLRPSSIFWCKSWKN